MRSLALVVGTLCVLSSVTSTGVGVAASSASGILSNKTKAEYLSGETLFLFGTWDDTHNATATLNHQFFTAIDTTTKQVLWNVLPIQPEPDNPVQTAFCPHTVLAESKNYLMLQRDGSPLGGQTTRYLWFLQKTPPGVQLVLNLDKNLAKCVDPRPKTSNSTLLHQQVTVDPNSDIFYFNGGESCIYRFSLGDVKTGDYSFNSGLLSPMPQVGNFSHTPTLVPRGIFQYLEGFLYFQTTEGVLFAKQTNNVKAWSNEGLFAYLDMGSSNEMGPITQAYGNLYMASRERLFCLGAPVLSTITTTAAKPETVPLKWLHYLGPSVAPASSYYYSTKLDIVAQSGMIYATTITMYTNPWGANYAPHMTRFFAEYSSQVATKKGMQDPTQNAKASSWRKGDIVHVSDPDDRLQLSVALPNNCQGPAFHMFDFGVVLLTSQSHNLTLLNLAPAGTKLSQSTTMRLGDVSCSPFFYRGSTVMPPYYLYSGDVLPSNAASGTVWLTCQNNKNSSLEALEVNFKGEVVNKVTSGLGNNSQPETFFVARHNPKTVSYTNHLEDPTLLTMVDLPATPRPPSTLPTSVVGLAAEIGLAPVGSKVTIGPVPPNPNNDQSESSSGSTTTASPSSGAAPKPKKLPLVLIAGVVGAIVVIGTVVGLCVCRHAKAKQQQGGASEQSLNSGEETALYGAAKV